MCVSLPRIHEADFKMEIYLKIAQLYLEEQDHVSAEAYINRRAALLQSEVAKKEVCTIYAFSQACHPFSYAKDIAHYAVTKHTLC